MIIFQSKKFQSKSATLYGIQKIVGRVTKSSIGLDKVEYDIVKKVTQKFLLLGEQVIISKEKRGKGR